MILDVKESNPPIYGPSSWFGMCPSLMVLEYDSNLVPCCGFVCHETLGERAIDLQISNNSTSTHHPLDWHEMQQSSSQVIHLAASWNLLQGDTFVKFSMDHVRKWQGFVIIKPSCLNTIIQKPYLGVVIMPLWPHCSTLNHVDVPCAQSHTSQSSNFTSCHSS